MHFENIALNEACNWAGHLTENIPDSNERGVFLCYARKNDGVKQKETQSLKQSQQADVSKGKKKKKRCRDHFAPPKTP
jgi:hypothetical protein